MPSPILSMLVTLWFVLGGATGQSFAQTTADPPNGHQHGGEGFRRSFDNAESWAKQFDDPARDAWQKPDQVLDVLHLEPTARVADLGAGTGYFSVRIASRVPEGKVFAVDVERDMVRYLRERAQHEHIDVMVPVLASFESANLPEAVDLVLVVDTYHHIDDRVAYFARLKASLRRNGRLAIVDFKADSPVGPPLEHRISPERVIAELSAAGYSFLATHQFLPRQYFLVFQGNGP